MNSATSSIARVLRPRVQIAREAQLVAAALILPVFAAMFWFAIPRGTWPRVIIALAFVLALYLAAALTLRAVSIRLARDGIVERGFFRHDNRVPAKRIASAVVLDVYRGSTSETTWLLFLLDAREGLLLRMRGELWSNDDIDAVATAFDVPVNRPVDPITGSQLRTALAEQLYWFERWPWAGRLTAVGVIAALALILIALMSPAALVVA